MEQIRSQGFRAVEGFDSLTQSTFDAAYKGTLVWLKEQGIITFSVPQDKTIENAEVREITIQSTTTPPEDLITDFLAARNLASVIKKSALEEELKRQVKDEDFLKEKLNYFVDQVMKIDAVKNHNKAAVMKDLNTT